MYDPVTVRFMQEDTYRGEEEDPLSLNLHTYCHNNPIGYYDPSGHFSWLALIKFATELITFSGAAAFLSNAASFEQSFTYMYAAGGASNAAGQRMAGKSVDYEEMTRAAESSATFYSAGYFFNNTPLGSIIKQKASATMNPLKEGIKSLKNNTVSKFSKATTYTKNTFNKLTNKFKKAPKTDMSIPASEIAKTSIDLLKVSGSIQKNAVSKGASKPKLPAAEDNVGNRLRRAGKSLTWVDDVVNYISKNGKLPDNFITKSEAAKLGWDPKAGNLAEIALGKSIGGDIFKNKGNLLPTAPGRVWYEADINYASGFRGTNRIVYSNDGLIYKSIDHYKTFTKIK